MCKMTFVEKPLHNVLLTSYQTTKIIMATKYLAIAWFLIFMISFEIVRASTRLSLLMTPQDNERYRYVTVTGNCSKIFGFVILMSTIILTFPHPNNVEKHGILQDVTITAKQLVVTVTSQNSHHNVFYAAMKIHNMLRHNDTDCHILYMSFQETAIFDCTEASTGRFISLNL